MDSGGQAHEAAPHNEPFSAPEPPPLRRWQALAAAVWHQTLHGLPVVLWLALLTLVIEAPSIRELPFLQVFENVEGSFMRQVVQTVVRHQYSQAEAPPAIPVSVSDRIKLIEVSAPMRISEFEALPENLADSEIDRVGGVRPIDRRAMATLIEKLADRLGQLPLDARPRVVAIDVDLAPLVQKPPTANEASTDELRIALDKLRQQAHVIVIALDRSTPEQRLPRNEFMRGVACTRSGLSEAAATALDPAAKRPENAPHGLYFASPRLFQGIYEYPLRYPFEPKSEAADGSEFPSLGNLIRLRLDEPGTPAALTRLCDEAYEPRQNEAKDCILEDRIAAAPGAGCPAFKLDDYEQRFINWRLLESGLIDRTQIKSFESLRRCPEGETCPAKLDDDALTAGALLIGIDGGARHDKLDGATLAPDPVSGGMLHALQAQSSMKGYKLEEAHFSAFLVDLGLGTLFVLLWSLAKALLARVEAGLPRIVALLKRLLPLSLSLAIGWLSVYWISPALLTHGIWANPIYVLAGLAVHAYVEAGEAAAAGHGAHGPDFSYGAIGLWRYWRKGDWGRATWLSRADVLLPIGLALAIALPGVYLLGRHVAHGFYPDAHAAAPKPGHARH